MGLNASGLPFLLIESLIQSSNMPFCSQAQKTCFTILRKIVELWGGADGPPGFSDFLYARIVPACFQAPLKATFDLGDAPDRACPGGERPVPQGGRGEEGPGAGPVPEGEVPAHPERGAREGGGVLQGSGLPGHKGIQELSQGERV